MYLDRECVCDNEVVGDRQLLANHDPAQVGAAVLRSGLDQAETRVARTWQHLKIS